MMKKIQIAPLVKSIDSLIDAIDMLLMKADEDLEEELEAEGYVATAEAVETINALEDGWTEAYNDQCDDLLERLQSALGVDDFIENTWPKMKNETDLRDAIYDVFHDRFLSMLEASVVGWLKGDDPDLLADGMEILSKPAKDFVEGWSSQLADIMQLSTNEQIEKVLLNGQEKHLSVAQVTQNIAESGIREPGYKARRAAITEVLRSESYGQLEAMKQNPAVAEKEWEHTGMHKNKPRPNHVAIGGQRKPVNEPFDLEGADGGMYHPMCPRDTNLPAGETINCHCLMKSVRDPNWKNLSVEERRALREQYMQAAAAEDDDDIETYLRNNMPHDFQDERNVGEPISKERLEAFAASAKEKGIRLGSDPDGYGNFELYCGDPDVLHNVLDRTDELMTMAKENGLLKERDDIILLYDNVLGYNGDYSAIDVGAFAETKGKTIILNKFMFDDTEYLKKEYASALDNKYFAQGTSYEHIIDHEFGHIIDKRNPGLRDAVIKVLQGEAGDGNMTLQETILTKVSGYAAIYPPGDEYRELISELLSGSRGSDSEYAMGVLKKAGVLK